MTLGLTARTASLPSEDLAAYQNHCRQFRDDHRPKGANEIQLAQDLADTSWRLNRIPLLEADLLHRATNPPTEEDRIAFDIVDAHRAIATLGLHSARLSKQFDKTLEQLHAIQADRREWERRTLRDAAAILQLHEHKGLPYHPTQDGFVFSKAEIEEFAANARCVRTRPGKWNP